MALKHILDPSVGPLNHSVDLERSARSKAALSAQFHTGIAKLMFSTLRPCTLPKEIVSELFFVPENGASGLCFQITRIADPMLAQTLI